MAEKWVAVPGTSEHQLGLAVDINQDSSRSTADEVYSWLAQNAYKYGFILRYPQDKTDITGKDYEPWHYRYVGIDIATQLLAALSMLPWCLSLINNAALDYDYAGIGCFLAAIVYAFSVVTGILGLTFAGRLHRHRWCRTLAYIQLAAGVLLIFPLQAYTILTLPPLFIVTVLYLFGVGWSEKRDSKQQ